MTKQPLPEKNDLPVIHKLVQEDLNERLAIGLETYGAPLQPFNGRDALQDAYEEVLDLACYLRQLMYERDNPQTPKEPKPNIEAKPREKNCPCGKWKMYYGAYDYEGYTYRCRGCLRSITSCQCY